jgi:hypothetical protein
MKLFSFLKKQKETIELDLPEVPTKSKQIASDEEIYYERVEFESDRFTLEDCKTEEEKKEKLLNFSLEYEKKANSLFHTYNFLRLFSRSADKDNKYNEKMIILDKQINRMKKMYEDAKKKIDIIKYIEVENSELELIANIASDILLLFSEIENELDNIKGRYYKHLKMASFSICNDKSYQELDAINKNINQMISEYKHINDAYDFFYYNSGSLIVDTINALVACIQNSNNKDLKKDYDFSYFLNSDYVVAMTFAEWIELFTKIKYVMRVASKVELFDYLNFRELYTELEKRYILMLIFNEMKK